MSPNHAGFFWQFLFSDVITMKIRYSFGFNESGELFADKNLSLLRNGFDSCRTVDVSTIISLTPCDAIKDRINWTSMQRGAQAYISRETEFDPFTGLANKLLDLK